MRGRTRINPPSQGRRGTDRRRRYRHTEERPEARTRPEPDSSPFDIEDFVYAVWGVHAADSLASER
jgi:hypothetical protein